MTGHPQILFAATMLSVAALAAWLFWIVPTLSRPGIFFAVTVPARFPETEEARAILRSYRLRVLLHVLIAMALVASGALTHKFPLLIVGFLWLMTGPLAAIAAAHKKVLQHAMPPATIREAALAPRSPQLPGGWAAQLGPYAILLFTGLYLRTHWDDIPGRFPVHWGANGLPNGWASRTLMGVYGPLLFGAGMIAMIAIISYVVSHTARNVEQAVGKPSARSYPQKIAIVNLGIEYFVGAVYAMAGLLPFTGSPGAAPILIFPLIILAGVIALRGWLRRGHDTVRIHGDGTDDAGWRLGLFYYSPEDPALFVEKRIGIGYTLNFARPMAWLFVVMMLLLPLGLAFATLSTR